MLILHIWFERLFRTLRLLEQLYDRTDKHNDEYASNRRQFAKAEKPGCPLCARHYAAPNWSCNKGMRYHARQG